MQLDATWPTPAEKIAMKIKTKIKAGPHERC
jgi:hypothetical protein